MCVSFFLGGAVVRLDVPIISAVFCEKINILNSMFCCNEVKYIWVLLNLDLFKFQLISITTTIYKILMNSEHKEVDDIFDAIMWNKYFFFSAELFQ